MTLRSAFLSWGLIFAVPVFTFAADTELTKNLAKVRAVGVKGEGHREAMGEALNALSGLNSVPFLISLDGNQKNGVLASVRADRHFASRPGEAFWLRVARGRRPPQQVTS